MARNRRLVGGGSVALMCAAVATTLAITNGRPDEGRHPYVGLMVALDSAGIPLWRCSGSLISPTVFLTAGHCTEPPAAHIEIWFTKGPCRRILIFWRRRMQILTNPFRATIHRRSTGIPVKAMSVGPRIHIQTSAPAAVPGSHGSRVVTSE